MITGKLQQQSFDKGGDQALQEGEHLHEHSPLPDHPVGLWLRMLQLLDGVAELGQAAREHVCSSSGNAERNDARKVDGRGH